MTQINEQLKVLSQIQDLDLLADQIRGKKTALPTQLQTLQDSIRKAETLVKQRAGEVADKQKQIQQSDAALEMNRDRAARASQKLENVGNTKEFQAATKETDQLKRLNVELTAQREKLVKELDAIQALYAAAEKSVADLRSELDAKGAEFQGIVGGLEEELRKLGEKRIGLASQGLPQAVLVRYDRIRAARGGLGVAGVQSGRCSGCNMTLPPQLFNLVQKGVELCTCPSCSRIFVGQASTPDSLN